MRLSEIRKIIAENKPFLSIKSNPHSRDNNYTYVSNMPELLAHLDELSTIPSLTGYINTALASAPTISAIGTPDAILVSTGELNQFHTHIANLSKKCDTIIELADTILPAPEENMLCIKIPDDSTLIETSDILKDLSRFFEEFRSAGKLEGEIKFYGVEAGSCWFDILITATSTATVVNIIINSIYNMLEKYLTIKHAQLQAEEYKIHNNALSDLGNLLHAMCEKQVENIISDQNFDCDEEGKLRLISQIEKIAKLIIKGGRITPSLNAPQEEYGKILEKTSQIGSMLEKIEQLSLSEKGDKKLPPPSDQD